ncbi:unnamed protein product, partial [Rhizoctonia solani]
YVSVIACHIWWDARVGFVSLFPTTLVKTTDQYLRAFGVISENQGGSNDCLWESHKMGEVGGIFT